MADRLTNQHDDSEHQDGRSPSQDNRQPDQPRSRPGVTGFAALVDAFMSSFRQASAAQNQSPQQQESQGQSQYTQRVAQSVPNPPSQAAAATATTVSSSSTDIQSEQELTADHNHRPPEATSTESAQPPDREVERPEVDQTRSSEAGNEASAQGSTTTPSQGTNTDTPPRVLYFRMPILTHDGQSATLAFHPGPIPVPPHLTPLEPEQPNYLGRERGNGRASGYHLPTAPIFVPLGASPLPFSFIFDTQTNTGWPITAISSNPPGPMQEPGFVAGPPFHVALNISFGPPPQPELPDPERASRFVGSLERADAELRQRMSRLSMGAIGDYGGRQDNEGGEGALGCGICLDEYPNEDRPEWIGGQASKDEEVVAVPCAGHHTLHHRCLYEWLSKTPPSEWTCPFCRAGLDKQKVESSANVTNGTGQRQDTTNNVAKQAEQEAKSRSLRDEVRLREKARRWRCDSPACLPRYPRKNSISSFSRITSNKLVSLIPCRHTLHLDCLCTSMKLDQAELSDDESDEGSDEEVEEGEEEEGIEEEVGGEEAARSQSQCHMLEQNSNVEETVGKWVKCPNCRHEAWAELPKKKSKRVAAAKAKLAKKSETVMPTFGARERARLRDMQKDAQDGGDADVSEGQKRGREQAPLSSM